MALPAMDLAIEAFEAGYDRRAPCKVFVQRAEVHLGDFGIKILLLGPY